METGRSKHNLWMCLNFVLNNGSSAWEISTCEYDFSITVLVRRQSGLCLDNKDQSRVPDRMIGPLSRRCREQGQWPCRSIGDRAKGPPPPPRRSCSAKALELPERVLNAIIPQAERAEA